MTRSGAGQVGPFAISIDSDTSSFRPRLGFDTAIYASRFTANALHGQSSTLQVLRAWGRGWRNSKRPKNLTSPILMMHSDYSSAIPILAYQLEVGGAVVARLAGAMVIRAVWGGSLVLDGLVVAVGPLRGERW